MRPRVLLRSRTGQTMASCPVSAERLGVVLDLVTKGTISMRAGKDVVRVRAAAAAEVCAIFRLKCVCARASLCARAVFEPARAQRLFTDDRDPVEVVREAGLTQVSDEDVLRELCERVVASPMGVHAVVRYPRRGALAIRPLVGVALKESGGRGNPQRVSELISELVVAAAAAAATGAGGGDKR